jgi:hypothetical protein
MLPVEDEELGFTKLLIDPNWKAMFPVADTDWCCNSVGKPNHEPPHEECG